MILARFWEAPGPPKLEKNLKNRFVLAFRFEGGFWKGSGKVLKGFREGFGSVLGRFWMDFGKILFLSPASHLERHV